MELVQVKILCTTITARYGTLNTDDILRTDSAYAEHLVKDCGAAEYVKATPDGAMHPNPIATRSRPIKLPIPL